MNQFPLVTILLPVFNGAKYIDKAVESIINQTYTNIELLVIDDGSSDETLEILSKYNDDRMQVIANKENKGLIYSLNKGISLAKGKYILRMDADDVSMPERTATQVEFMELHKNIGVSGTWLETFGLKEAEIWSSMTNDEEIKANLLFVSNLFHPTTIIRTQLLRDTGLTYNQDMLLVEDYDLWARLKNHCGFGNIPQVLLRYRLHDSNQNKQRKALQQYHANEVRLFLLKELGIVPRLEELELHQRISLGQVRPTEIETARMWINRILSANELVKVYNQSSLEKVCNLKLL